MSPAVEVISVPYHAGVADCRVGKGPPHLLEAGLERELREVAQDVGLTTIPPVEEFEGEIGRSFELVRRVAKAVAAAVAARRFPLVLAGNCNTTVGVFAGVGDGGVGLVWFDAHPDFDTPDERASGYFDGMGVATLAGQCWHRLAATIPGFRTVDLRRLVYCGIRDFDPGQLEKVRFHGIRAVLGARGGQVPFAADLGRLLGSAPFDRAVVHLDLDCLDPSVGRANEYAAPDRLDSDELIACLATTCAHARPVAMTIASFNPDLEEGSRLAATAIAAAKLVARHAGAPG